MQDSINKPGEESVNPALIQHMQLMYAWNAYQDFIKDADRKIMSQYQESTTHLRIAFWVNILTHVVFFILGIFILIIGLLVTWNNPSQSFSGIGLSFCGLILLIIILFHNPFKETRQAINDHAKIQIVFSGYFRELNQLDAVFKEFILSEKFDIDSLQKIFDQIQTAIENNIDVLTHTID